jgi:hypothetical protein
MASTIAQIVFTPLTTAHLLLQLQMHSALLPKPRLPCGDPPNSSPRQKENSSSWNCGSFISAPPAFNNWTSFPATLLGHLWLLTTTHFGSLILRRRLKYENRRPNDWQYKLPNANDGSTWTFDLFAYPLPITPDPQLQLTVSSFLMMATPCTSF